METEKKSYPEYPQAILEQFAGWNYELASRTYSYEAKTFRLTPDQERVLLSLMSKKTLPDKDLTALIEGKTILRDVVTSLNKLFELMNVSLVIKPGRSRSYVLADKSRETKNWEQQVRAYNAWISFEQIHPSLRYHQREQAFYLGEDRLSLTIQEHALLFELTDYLLFPTSMFFLSQFENYPSLLGHEESLEEFATRFNRILSQINLELVFHEPRPGHNGGYRLQKITPNQDSL
ncbi:MAG TPA: hypothetical protein VD999_01985 [Vitreimonas sp.]|nr:hypothetical protein [Vitreimonas sp.]